MNITQKQKGILFMILSALSFASMQVVVRMSREIPTMEQICVRNLFIKPCGAGRRHGIK